MNFINLTPHALTVEGLGTIPASGQVARVAVERRQLEGTAGVRLVSQTLGKVQGLPGYEPGKAFIVSAMVMDAVKKEDPARAGVDVFAPDTGPDAVRENGQVVKVLGLVC